MISRLELLVDRMDGQLSRRRKELTDIRLTSLRSSGSTAETIRRAGHILAYAHWEGFSKDVLAQYLNYLCDTRIKLDSLKVQLQSLNYWKIFKSVAASADFSAAIGLIQQFDERSSRYFLVDSDEMIRTGNLDSQKLRSLLNICALEYRPIYQTREHFIDQVLCGRRHRIAHGVLEPVSAAELATALDGVMELCQELNEQVQEALIYDHYSRP